MPKYIIQAIENWSNLEVILYCFIINLIVLLLSVSLGNYLIIKFAKNRISPNPPALVTQEYLLATCTLFINSLINILGWILWKNHFIKIDVEFSLKSIIDFAILFIVMDFSMFVLHRLAHIPQIYEILHKTHHKYKHVRPLTLFVLNPIETLSFGILWLFVLIIFNVSWPAVIAYLTANLVFGMLGHMGVELIKKDFSKIPILKFIASSEFHAVHHLDESTNYGFYTKIWDILYSKIKNRQ
jgi:Delta7-sterol 5-desaturase